MSGGLSGRPEWPRIFRIAEISTIAEMGLKFSLPQFGQCFISMEKTRARRVALVSWARNSNSVEEPLPYFFPAGHRVSHHKQIHPGRAPN